AESILERLIVQSDIKTRDLRNGKRATGEPDYLIEGRVGQDNNSPWFEFTLTNKKGEKTTPQKVGGGIAGLSYAEAATEVLNAINEQRFFGGSRPTSQEQIKQKALEYL